MNIKRKSNQNGLRFCIKTISVNMLPFQFVYILVDTLQTTVKTETLSWVWKEFCFIYYTTLKSQFIVTIH